jgi:Ca2+:H+ antiporter
MSSGQGNPPGPSKDLVQSPVNMSTPTSPTDSRHPLSRFETITDQNAGLSESVQSTDTIRRRPEPLMSYGM